MPATEAGVEGQLAEARSGGGVKALPFRLSKP